jgi:hypothetical protein
MFIGINNAIRRASAEVPHSRDDPLSSTTTKYNNLNVMVEDQPRYIKVKKRIFL